MTGLIPAEYWEYSLLDVLRGVATVFSSEDKAGLNLNGIGNCIPTRSARGGIVLALKALDIPAGAPIGIPAYSCPVVFKSVVTAGYKPVFIDIDPETYCLSIKDLVDKVSTVKAVIAIHMFGHLCDMPALLEITKGKPVIEDCAQSLGSKLNGRMAGSFGNITAFSFRSGKYLSVGEGGALHSRDERLCSRLGKLNASLPAPGRMEELKHIATTFIRTALRRKPLWGIAGYRVWSKYAETVKHTAQSPLVLEQTYRTDFRLSIHRLRSLDTAIAAQRGNANYYARTLEVSADMLTTEKPGTFLNRYLFPILFPSQAARDYVADHLFRQRISSIKPYQNISELAAAHYGYAGGCPIAENLSKRLLAIPAHHGLSQPTIRRIAESVNQAWARVKDR